MVLHTGAVDRNERERRTIAREWVRQGRGGKKGLDRSHAWNVPLFCGDRHARQGRLTRCGGAIRLLGGHRLQDAPTQHHTDDQAPAAVLMGPPAASDSRAFRHPQSPHIQKLRAVQYCRGAHCAEHGASPRRLATSTHTPPSAVRQQVQAARRTRLAPAIRETSLLIGQTLETQSPCTGTAVERRLTSPKKVLDPHQQFYRRAR